MALMMLAAWQTVRKLEMRIIAGCSRKGQRLDKTVRREFSFAHASYIRTVAPLGAILRASQQTVLSFRGPFAAWVYRAARVGFCVLSLEEE